MHADSRRRRAADLALLFTIVPIWVVWFAYGLRDGGSYQARSVGISVSAASGPQAYPVARVVSFEVTGENRPQTGDLLIALDGQDLGGFSSLKWEATSYTGVDPVEGSILLFERDGARRVHRLVMQSVWGWWRLLPFVVLSVLAAIICLWRASEWPQARICFALCMGAAFAFTYFEPESASAYYVQKGVNAVAYCLAYGVAIHIGHIFPQPPRVSSHFERLAPWLFGTGFAVNFAVVWWLPDAEWVEVRYVGSVLLFLAWTGCGLVMVSRNFRRADALARRQQKWIFLGFYIGSVPVMLWALFSMLELIPGSWQTTALLVSHVPIAAIPLGFLIAIFGYRFLDIDPLLSAATTFSILGSALLAAALTVVPRLGEAAAALAGVEPATGQMALSFGLALTVVPLQRGLRPQVERIFFREHRAFEGRALSLLERVGKAQRLPDLARSAGQGLDELFRPDSCVIYGRDGGSFACLFVRGRAVPPVFEGDGPLIHLLEGHADPLVADHHADRKLRGDFGAFDRAALETLDAAVVVPILASGTLVAFACLGPKRSGDVYTPTDVTWLVALADRVSAALTLLDQAHLAREARTLQKEMRRYVPGAIAEGVERGEGLETGEREVSVLFADLRGYTSYSEGKQATEIFSTINRYTETVSKIVIAHGGSVVEFNGDGMMAVFGAPLALEAKEQAAVGAGRAIVDGVANLPGTGPENRLDVGVGVATGIAYVGNIRAVDRWIWSAIGNTTNLAARLQALTRDLGAWMVIDEVTQQRAGEMAAGFEARSDVAVRGRSEQLQVFLLPISGGLQDGAHG